MSNESEALRDFIGSRMADTKNYWNLVALGPETSESYKYLLRVWKFLSATIADWRQENFLFDADIPDDRRCRRKCYSVVWVSFSRKSVSLFQMSNYLEDARSHRGAKRVEIDPDQNVVVLGVTSEERAVIKEWAGTIDYAKYDPKLRIKNLAGRRPMSDLAEFLKNSIKEEL